SQTSLLDRYNDLVETANNNVKALYDKAVASQTESIDRLVEESTKKLDAQSQLIKSNAAAAALNVETVKDAYLKQSAETDKLLSSYLELAQSTAELKDKIESVDFPSRLDTISRQILEYTEQQKTANELSSKILEAVKSDKVLKQAQSNEKTLSSIKTIAGIALFFAVVCAAAIAFLIVKGIH
ncbi:MAG: hypothetical protein IJ894_16575, partial [Bacteroidales bacterium]|nr:hypothetical protein [Bacteroidales bacterium]